ncbi:MAG: AlpA family transcriptional regulator [Gammaproteobacteria bacterium]|nr:AlpA family transcriptional regulator [Gammaproteobacteria bacterium]
MTSANEKVIRRPEVEARTGLPRSTLYDAIKRGSFPRPIKLSERSVAWVASEVDAWVAARIHEARRVA